MGPAMACNMAAASSAERTMGPMWSREDDNGNTSDFGTRPHVGFRPVMPFRALGNLMNPRVSLPREP